MKIDSVQFLKLRIFANPFKYDRYGNAAVVYLPWGRNAEIRMEITFTRKRRAK